jgi:predicted Holliday junction resolvase-like endonuclease
MKFNSVFFFCVLLCLALVSLCCNESKNAQLDKKFFDVGVQMAEKDAKKGCSEKKLSEADCNKFREDKLKEAREVIQEVIKEFDEACKKSIMLEDECVEKKQEMLKGMLAESKKW